MSYSKLKKPEKRTLNRSASFFVCSNPSSLKICALIKNRSCGGRVRGLWGSCD